MFAPKTRRVCAIRRPEVARVDDMSSERESSSLLQNDRGTSARAFAPIGALGALVLVVFVGTFAAFEGSNASFPSLGRGTWGHYGVTYRKPNGQIVLLPPYSDTCSRTCDRLASKSSALFAYEDQSCHVGGFGCGQGRLAKCRTCQTAPYKLHGEKKWHYVQCPQCVCDRLNHTGCNVCVSEYQFFKLNVVATRYKDGYVNIDGGGCAPTQVTKFAEIRLLSGNGARPVPLDPSGFSLPDGHLCSPDEGLTAATDGSNSTELCEIGAIDGPDGVDFVFASTAPTLLTHYELLTSSSCPGQDPTAWKLYGSTVSNTGPWVELATHRADPPRDRSKTYGLMQVC